VRVSEKRGTDKKRDKEKTGTKMRAFFLFLFFTRPLSLSLAYHLSFSCVLDFRKNRERKKEKKKERK
jgi:hypothetical protein